MAESVSRSRKPKQEAEGEKKMSLSPSATVQVPREELVTPPYSVQELRDCVPAHCFVKSNVTSFTYLAVDLAIVAALLFVGAWLHFRANMPTWLALIVWPIYWFVQGCVATGVWVLAHECGHGAFSPQWWVNDIVGWVFHSALLVPYFSWKFTHASHHLHTNHLGKDEVHVPPTSREINLPWGKTKMTMSILKHLILGWPFYLMQNVASNKQHKGQSNVNHFSPWSPLFTEAQRPYIILSDVGIIATVAALSLLGYKYGTPAVALLYLGPYLVVNMWLVLITKLQHTANDVPVYDETTFSWVKGQLCTVDRDFGWILNTVLHHINDTHVAHHLFSKMPHYHAEEATVHLKKKLGKYYRYRSANVVTQTLEVFGECVYVAEKNGVWWYPTIGDDHTELWAPQ
jgi:omega-6 fatty acid desaturase (delta-12 desaturase)